MLIHLRDYISNHFAKSFYCSPPKIKYFDPLWVKYGKVKAPSKSFWWGGWSVCKPGVVLILSLSLTKKCFKCFSMYKHVGFKNVCHRAGYGLPIDKKKIKLCPVYYTIC